MTKHIAVGGLVAAGFDITEQYLLVVSHAGRGVFSTESWDRIARSSEVAYPENGISIGIGPITGVRIYTKEINYESGELSLSNASGSITVDYDSGTLTIYDNRNETKKGA